MSKVFLLANDESTIYNFRRELIQRLIEDGHIVMVAFPRGGSRTDEIAGMGCHYIDLPMERKGTNPIKDVILISRIKKVLNRYSPDVLLTFTIKPNLYGGYVSNSLGIPHIANITGLGTAVENPGIMRKISLQLYRIFMKKTKCVFFQNEENKNFLQSKGIAINVAKLLPGSGVNLERFSLLPYPNDDVIRFLYIGRVMKEKGIDQFLEAVKIIREQQHNVEFHIIGPCEENYKELLVKYEEYGFIVYHGAQNDVRKFHKLSHCTIHPSYYPEGMSNVLLESAASGRPVITTNRSGCRETVEDGVTGFLIKEKDTEDLIEKIKIFIKMDFKTKKQMGLAGRKKVEKDDMANLNSLSPFRLS
jgi:glycosyltransferase involved in cell wall biosynthesis